MPCVFRREERLEDPSLIDGIDADAGVGDLQQHVGARRDVLVLCGVSASRSTFAVWIVNVPPSGIASRELTTRFRNDLRELAAIDEDQVELLFELAVDHDVLVEHPADESQRLVDECVEVEDLRP